ncbi:MAG: hypothetical protein ACFBSE_08770 [Prochloraceae cyanobacterium]
MKKSKNVKNLIIFYPLPRGILFHILYRHTMVRLSDRQLEDKNYSAIVSAVKSKLLLCDWVKGLI